MEVGEYQQPVDVGLIHLIKAAGWIVVSSFVIWALGLWIVDFGVILCDRGNCYLSSGVLSPVSCMAANAGLLSPSNHLLNPQLEQGMHRKVS